MRSTTVHARRRNSDPNGASFTGLSDFFVIDARLRHFVTEHCAIASSVDNLDDERC